MEPPPPEPTVSKGATPATPGTGSQGKTCGTCRHAYRTEIESGRKFWKCELVPETHGAGTDIRKKTPACAYWEPSDDQVPG